MAAYGRLPHVSGRIYEKEPNILEKKIQSSNYSWSYRTLSVKI